MQTTLKFKKTLKHKKHKGINHTFANHMNAMKMEETSESTHQKVSKEIKKGKTPQHEDSSLVTAFPLAT